MCPNIIQDPDVFREYTRIDLYEADYEPEKLQFYRMVDIPFVRELRRIGGDFKMP